MRIRLPVRPPNGFHPYYHGRSAKEQFVGCVQKPLRCGCQVVGNGTLKAPLTVRLCRSHRRFRPKYGHRPRPNRVTEE